MATRMYVLGLLCFLILGSSGRAFSVTVTGKERSATGDRSLLPEIYVAEIGVREATGRNDGPRVAMYLRYCGLPEGYEWCAAFVSWVYGQAGYAKPRNAWAAALFPAGRIVQHTPKQGDVFGIYITSKQRIGHCGFVDAWDGKWCITVEGNTNNAVVRKRRLVGTIHAVARWATAQIN